MRGQGLGRGRREGGREREGSGEAGGRTRGRGPEGGAQQLEAFKSRRSGLEGNEEAVSLCVARFGGGCPTNDAPDLACVNSLLPSSCHKALVGG